MSPTITSMTRAEELREQARAFHKANPEIWQLFVKYTNQVIAVGFKNYSGKSVFERIRWHMDVGGDGVTQFKINNNYCPFYTRAFMRMYPQHDGFFRTRKQTTEDKPATNLPELTPAHYREEETYGTATYQ